MAEQHEDVDEAMNTIMADMQVHLRTANLQLSNLSTIAQKGDEQLVEKFLSETVFVKVDGQHQLAENKIEVLQSQLYIACFWGFKDTVRGIIKLAKDQAIPLDVNAQNPRTLWTPLHAATFQEHGPLVMTLLDNGGDPRLEDSEGRTPVDFASASDKIWGHFASIGYKKTPRNILVEMGIIKKMEGDSSPRGGGNKSPREPGKGIRMAAYDRPESAYEYNNDPFMQASSTGDVLANESEPGQTGPSGPQFAIYK